MCQDLPITWRDSFCLAPLWILIFFFFLMFRKQCCAYFLLTGLEGNRPHMLIGIVVRQKVKRPGDPTESTMSGKSAHSTNRSQSGPSAKKMRVSRDEETEAYSPTANGEEVVGTEALYIPTPTTGPARAASSASSSSSSTPSCAVLHGQSASTSAAKEDASSVSASDSKAEGIEWLNVFVVVASCDKHVRL